MLFSHFITAHAVLVTVANLANAFSPTANNNLAVYWGQNSYGATNPANTTSWQKNLSAYCQDDVIDIIPLAFLDVFFGADGLPELNFANTCNPTTFPTIGGSQLPNCTFMEDDIKACQEAGKIVTLSLGGAAGASAFTSNAQATTFANQIWDLFLGGSNVSLPRPLGNTPLDGIDLDIEGGGTEYFAAFVRTIRELAEEATTPTVNSTSSATTNAVAPPKKYYISAAPQCPYPDAYMGAVLNEAYFDFVFVQFYNNACGIDDFPLDWTFPLWSNWARTTSVNPNVKIYIGAPASPSAASAASYVNASVLGAIAQAMALNTSSEGLDSEAFGGVMLWDASQAYANDRYDKQVKSYLDAISSAVSNNSSDLAARRSKRWLTRQSPR